MKKLFLSFFLIFTVVPSTFALDAAREKDIQKIEDYFNDLKSLKGEFLQILPNGQKLTGRIYLQRPGKMRFEYDAPNNISIIATGKTLVHYDKDLEQASRMSQKSTMADFLTRHPLKIGDDVQVLNFQKNSRNWQLTLKSNVENDKEITLIFEEKPKFRLARWKVKDIDGNTTTLHLRDYQTDIKLDKFLFSFISPEWEKKKWKSRGYTP